MVLSLSPNIQSQTFSAQEIKDCNALYIIQQEFSQPAMGVDLSQPPQSEPSISLQNPTLLNWYKDPYVNLPHHLPSGLNQSSCHYLLVTHYTPHHFAACLPICLIGHPIIIQCLLLTPSVCHSSAHLPNWSSCCYLLITHYSLHLFTICPLTSIHHYTLSSILECLPMCQVLLHWISASKHLL